jgi:hypothetical protein
MHARPNESCLVRDGSHAQHSLNEKVTGCYTCCLLWVCVPSDTDQDFKRGRACAKKITRSLTHLISGLRQQRRDMPMF